jgi:DNA-binding transcriptional regulator YiaG
MSNNCSLIPIRKCTTPHLADSCVLEVRSVWRSDIALLGVTQSELADLTNTPLRTVQRWFGRDGMPTLTAFWQVHKLAEEIRASGRKAAAG